MYSQLFRPHPNLADEVNSAICRSEIEGGVFLDSLPPGTNLEIQTENRAYLLVAQGKGKALISGHPDFRPEPVMVGIHGSTRGGSMLKVGYLDAACAWNLDISRLAPSPPLESGKSGSSKFPCL